MKKMILKNLVILGIFTLFFSCQDREGCTDPASDNFDINAEIDNGSCIPMTEKFLGLYDTEEVCEFDAYTYPMSIFASYEDPFEIIITNFGDLAINVRAFVDGRYLTLPDQFIYKDGDEIAILEGSGEIINGILSIRYFYGQNGSNAYLCRINGAQY